METTSRTLRLLANGLLPLTRIRFPNPSQRQSMLWHPVREVRKQISTYFSCVSEYHLILSGRAQKPTLFGRWLLCKSTFQRCSFASFELVDITPKSQTWFKSIVMHNAIDQKTRTRPIADFMRWSKESTVKRCPELPLQNNSRRWTICKFELSFLWIWLLSPWFFGVWQALHREKRLASVAIAFHCKQNPRYEEDQADSVFIRAWQAQAAKLQFFESAP